MGKIFTFWSPCHSAGTTTSAILLANQLSKEYSVCVIDLDLNNSDVGFLLNIFDSEHNIDNLAPYIVGGSLTADIFKSNLIPVKKFYVLQGTKNTEKAAFFKQEEIEPVIDIARDLFDVVILNTSPVFDNIATFLALKKSDMTLIVMNQKLAHYNKLNKKMNTILNLSSRPFIILNKNMKGLNISAEDIYNMVNIAISPIEYLPENQIINQLNLEKNMIDVFFDNRNKRFTNDMQAISEKMKDVMNFQ